MGSRFGRYALLPVKGTRINSSSIGGGVKFKKQFSRNINLEIDALSINHGTFDASDDFRRD
jgi:hypothetical protein